MRCSSRLPPGTALVGKLVGTPVGFALGHPAERIDINHVCEWADVTRCSLAKTRMDACRRRMSRKTPTPATSVAFADDRQHLLASMIETWVRAAVTSKTAMCRFRCRRRIRCVLVAKSC
jgi:hypothetical protein